MSQLLVRPIHNTLWNNQYVYATETDLVSNYTFYNNDVTIGVNTYEELGIVTYQSKSYSFRFNKGIYTIVVSNTLSILFDNDVLLAVKSENNTDVLPSNTNDIESVNTYFYDEEKELDEIIF